MKCDYRLVLDNLMDLTHETFVHGSSIGQRAVAEAPFVATHGDRTATVTRWMEDIDAPPFWAGQLKHATGYEGKVDRWQIIRFEAPCTIAIDVGVAPAGSGAAGRQGDRSKGVNGFVLNTITPETDTTCHYFWAFARNYCLGEQRLTHELREGVAVDLPRGRADSRSAAAGHRRAPRLQLLQPEHRRRLDVGAAADRQHGARRNARRTSAPA